MGYNYQKNNANIGKSLTPGNFIEFPIEWRKPHCSKFIRSETTSKTKLLLQVENGEKLHFRILEIVEDTNWGKMLLWRTAPWHWSIHHGVMLFPNWPGNSPGLKLMNCREFKLRSCWIKNTPCQKLGWKESLSRCGRTLHHHTFNCFTKASQGAWKFKLMPRKVTLSRSRISQILYAFFDKKLNCIIILSIYFLAR